MKYFKILWITALLTVTSTFGAVTVETDIDEAKVENAYSECFTRTFTISGSSGTVQHVKLKLDIEHTRRSDLRVTLTSPDNTTVILSQHNGGSSDNLIVDFDDQYTTNITSYNSDIPNQRNAFLPFQPQDAFSSFIGESINGDWDLQICDDVHAGLVWNVEGDVGYYYKSIIEISDVVLPPPPAMIADDFNADADYTNSSGTVPWSGPWVEFGDSNRNPFSNPETGAIRLTGTGLAFNYGTGEDQLTASKNIVRTFNLEGKKDVVIRGNIPSNSLATGDELWMDIWSIVDNDWQPALFIQNGDTAYQLNIPNSILNEVATRYSKIRFRTKTGDNWDTASYIRLDNIQITFNSKDTDGDGIVDSLDKDNDNDGILDSVENAVTLTGISPTTTWKKIDETKTHGDLGSLIVELEESTDVLFDSLISMAAMNSSGQGFWTPESVNSIVAAPALALVIRADETEIRELKINLPKATKKVLVHIDRLGAWDSDPHKTNSAIFTLVDSSLGGGIGTFTMTKLSGNGNMVVDSNGYFFHRRLDDLANGSTDSFPTDGGAGAGTIEISNNTAFTSLTFDIHMLNSSGIRATLGDGIYLLIEAETNSTGSHDTDRDGISDEYDLDSDNDGIPDTIEAQATVGWIKIAGGTNVDIDGIPTELGGVGLTPISTVDGDSVPDFIDNDSDGDDIPDCIEGNVNIGPNGKCPIIDVLTDGMSADAGSDGNYSNIYGDVNDTTTKLVGYDASLTEVAYRIANVCGTPEWNFTAMQWKTISISCAVTQGIDTIFASLGTYGDSGDWMMYKQVSDFSGTSASMVELAYNEVLVPGQGYWIITETDQDASSVLNNSSLTKTKTVRQLAVNHSVDLNASFTEVHTYTGLPGGMADVQKVILGNPFPRAFHLGLMFISNDGGSNYYPMSDGTNVSPFAKQIVYTYDHTGKDPVNYMAKTPAGTPGFGDSIAPGQGFWLRLESAPGDNQVDYPFEK